MFLFILGALVAFTIAILFVAGAVTDGANAEKPGDSRLQAEIAQRIAPVGDVKIAAANAAPAAPKAGDVVVTEACASCHASGALGAPKIGEKGDWEARMAGGVDALTASAIAGKGMMPPRGGAAALSDEEIRAAIVHMLKESGIDGDGATAEAAPAAEAPVETAAAAPAAEAAPAEPAAAASYDLARGEAIYNKACGVCHANGIAGAPRLGDQAAWADRIAAGMDSMVSNAINGKNGMPPKGGHAYLSDAEIADVVAYMADQSK